MTEGGGTIRATNLIGAVVMGRAQMATTLGFHIILAGLGVALLMVVTLARGGPVGKEKLR